MQISATQILCIMCLTGKMAAQPDPQPSSVEGRPTIPAGKCYGKPRNNCSGGKCDCDDDVFVFYDSSGKVKYAVCASDCNNRTTCPPYTYAAADKFCSYGRCHIMCPLFSNPCPAGSECVQIEGLHVNMCVYEVG